jgi:hypothetical protein
MLKRFAETHNLPYRLAFQAGETLSDFYVVKEIPHMVIIDREGKVQLIRGPVVGQALDTIDKTIAALIGDDTAEGQ